MSEQTRVLEGQLTVSDVMSHKLVTVALGTPLARVAEVLAQGHSRYVLVTDARGALVGVVSDRDLLRYMAPWQGNSPAALDGKTVESVMFTKFVAGSPDSNPDDMASLLAEGSIQCLPIIEAGNLVGVMTSEDLLLSWNRLHPVIEQASSDKLTGLANRAMFDRRLAEELQRARRQNISLALLLLDVDHFKEVNDTCGHLVGDSVLRMVARCLRRHLRNYDVLARFGGDEFTAICCVSGPTDVHAPIERLQHEVRSLSVPLETGRQGITLSIGAAVLRRRFGDITTTQFLAAADGCLYRAKADGRDRVFSTELDDGASLCSPDRATSTAV